jgi:DNA-binding XRE family transcriptional regulator
MQNSVRATRIHRGLGQSELAELAGVTRQSVGAIEAGRHSPSVDAALRIARVLQVDVETLFSPPQQEPYEPIAGKGHPGTPVVIAKVGDRRVYAPVRNLLGTSESWARADGFLGDDGVERFANVEDAGFVIGGCDPLLGLAASLLDYRRGPRIIPVHLSTGAAILALANGVVHGVVVHGQKDSLPVPPLGVHRWRFASWQVGVAFSARRGLTTIEQLAERRLRTAQREQGAGTQRALERALAGVGATTLPGPRVEGHIDAARHVASGVPAGITMEAAANAFGLQFLPLENHDSELWIDARHVRHQSAIELVSLLNDPALLHRAQHLPGYDVNHMGTEVFV